jgi:hypothetical protein
VTERVLTARDLNRALLAQQLLLERARLSLPKAMERVGGLQTQYAPSGYVGLWSRVQNFERDALTRALERRTVVQATLMRVTIHMVSAREYWLFAIGLRRPRRDDNAPFLDPPDTCDYERLSRSVRKEVDEEAERLGAFHN